jgi:adenosylmethionine-8-amino-7-oxononanoate aminotransferase
VGGRSEVHRRFNPWLFPAQTFPAPVHSECAGQVARSDASASLAALEALLVRDAATTACVILEPRVQGAAGMVQQPAGFVKSVATLCRRHGVHLILDEVFTGFGRLGALTVAELEGVVPDFLCLAKGLAAGYLPLAATLTSEQVYAAFLGKFSEGKTFFHGHTFSGNPLGCAVARASLRKLQPMLASGQVAERADLLGREMAAAFAGQPHVRAYRQVGLTGSVEFKPSGADRWPTDTRAGYRVALAARRHGLVIRPLGDSILFVPPISIQADEVKHLVRAVRLAMDETLAGLVA